MISQEEKLTVHQSSKGLSPTNKGVLVNSICMILIALSLCMALISIYTSPSSTTRRENLLTEMISYDSAHFKSYLHYPYTSSARQSLALYTRVIIPAKKVKWVAKIFLKVFHSQEANKNIVYLRITKYMPVNSNYMYCQFHCLCQVPQMPAIILIPPCSSGGVVERKSVWKKAVFLTDCS